MKRNRMNDILKKGLAVLIAGVVMTTPILANGIYVYAEEGSTVSGNSVENIEEIVDEVEIEDVEEVTPTTVSGNELPENTEAGNISADGEMSTESEEEGSEDEVTDAKEIRLEKEMNGILVVATAKAGVLPENAVLDVQEITTTKAIEMAVEGTVTTTEEVQEIKSFDIKIWSDGQEVQPEDGTVSITFEGIVLAADEKASVVYTSDDASKVEKKNTEVSGDAVSFEAEHFSVYNVVITVNTSVQTDNNEIVPIYVANDGYASISIEGFDITKLTMTNSDTAIVDATIIYSGANVRLTSKKNVGISNIALSDGTKSITYEVHVQDKPSMTASEFVDAFATTLNGSQKLQTVMKEYFLEDKNSRKVDSSALEGKRRVAVFDAFEENGINVSNLSFQYAKRIEDNQIVYYLYYSPLDLNVYYGETGKAAREGLSKNGINQYAQVTTYKLVEGTWEKVEDNKMYALKATNDILVSGQGNTDYMVLATGVENTQDSIDEIEATYTLTFEVADEYKDDYDLTGGIAQSVGGDKVSTEKTDRITNFGVVLKEQGTTGRIDGVTMTLANDVTGYKNGEQMTFTAGTVVSTVNANGGASVDFNDGFGHTYFTPGTEVKLLVKPIFFDVNFVNDDNTTPILTQTITNDVKATAPSESDFFTTMGNFADKATADKYSSFKGWTADGGKTVLTSEDVHEAKVTKSITYTAVYETVAKFYVTRNGSSWNSLKNSSTNSNAGILDNSVYDVYKNRRLNAGVNITGADMAKLIKGMPATTYTEGEITYEVMPYSIVKENDGWHVDCFIVQENEYQVIYLSRNGEKLSTKLVSSEEQEMQEAPDRSEATYAEKKGSYVYSFKEWTDRTVDADNKLVTIKESYELSKIYANVYVLTTGHELPTTEEELAKIPVSSNNYVKVGMVELVFDKAKAVVKDNMKLLFGSSNVLAADGYILEAEKGNLGINASISKNAIEVLAGMDDSYNFTGHTMEWFVMKYYEKDGFHLDGVPVVRSAPEPTPEEEETPAVTPTTPATTTPATPATPATTTVAPLTIVPTDDAVVVAQAVAPVAPVAPILDDAVDIEDEEVALAAAPEENETEGTDASEETELVNIEEEETPLAATHENDCIIHWIILLLTLAYVVFALCRAIARQKKIKELANESEGEVIV